MNRLHEQSRRARPGGAKRPTKKDQILSLFLSGINQVEDIAIITACRPSYVGAVLHEAELLPGYFDLYTSSAHPMNVYSKFFAGSLGFRDIDTARRSVQTIDRYYRQFELAGDRAGQHHALLMALTMFNRARWTGKAEEAEVFGRWLEDRMQEASVDNGEPQAVLSEGRTRRRRRGMSLRKSQPDTRFPNSVNSR